MNSRWPHYHTWERVNDGLVEAPNVADIMFVMKYVLLTLVAAVGLAERIEFMVLKEGVLQERLRMAHSKISERYRRLETLFQETGCVGEALRQQKVRGSKEPNLICAVAATGDSPRKILVGAHFDFVGGQGIVDNWSGAVLLPSLAEFMRKSPRKHSFEFIGFAAEEKGLLGSAAYVKSLTKQDRANIDAVITMDSLGLSPIKCWPNSSTPRLIGAAKAIADGLKIDFTGVNVERVGSTDSESFRDAKIPVLSLHSVTQQTWQTINSHKDVWSAVSWKDYYDSHKMISALLVYLDQTLP